MDRANLKQLAKDNLGRNYKNILIYEILAAILLLSFISIEYNTNSGVILTLFNFNINITNSSLTGILALSSTIIGIYTFLIMPIVNYGLANKLKYFSYDDHNEFDFFIGAKENYKGIFVLNYMVYLKMFLWALCFIIPGIIAAYKYRYVNEIYEEHRDWTYKQVIDESIRMTQGHKWDLFILDLSFFLWHLLFAFLDVFTLGLAQYFLKPYVSMTNVYAYHYLKSQNYNSTI